MTRPTLGKGLERGGKAEQAVWNEFAGERERPRNLADAIKAGYRAGSSRGQALPEPDEEDFPEGRIVYRMHRARERNAKLVQAAKARFLKR